MKAIILAAGKGNRLSPLTEETPKPLINIHEKKILDYILESLPEEISEIIIVVKYKQEQIRDFFEKNMHKQKITLIEQQEGLKGTLAALFSAKPYLEKNERFLVINGDDIHSKEEIREYLRFPRSYGIQSMIMPGYHAVDVEGGLVKRLRDATEEEKIQGTPISTGAYVLDTNIFDFEPVVLRDGEIGLPQTILAHIETYPIHGIYTTKWIPINNHSELEKARIILSKRKNT